jgi:hypothetical protein
MGNSLIKIKNLIHQGHYHKSENTPRVRENNFICIWYWTYWFLFGGIEGLTLAKQALLPLEPLCKPDKWIYT